MLSVRANMLVKHGYEVIMLTYEQNGEPYPYPLLPQVECMDLGVRLYNAYKTNILLRPLKKWLLRRQLSKAIRMFLTEQKPDIVVCTDKDSNEQNALSRARSTEKIVIEAHTGMIDHWMQVRQTTSRLRHRLALFNLRKLQRAASHFDVLVALTADDARCWSPFVKTVVIPNYCPNNPDNFADLEVEKKRVIAVGRLNPQKGQDLLLQAWTQVERQHPDWHLDIFGDGSEKESLLAQLSQLELHGVTLHASTPDIYAQYVASDFLVCSSRWESFGLILIEAMSCGLPVVSFDCDNGPRNIIKNGEDGLLAEKGNVDDLARKIIQLIEHPEQRQEMGRQARQNVKRFHQDTVFRQYTDLYQRLSAGSI